MQPLINATGNATPAVMFNPQSCSAATASRRLTAYTADPAPTSIPATRRFLLSVPPDSAGIAVAESLLLASTCSFPGTYYCLLLCAILLSAFVCILSV